MDIQQILIMVPMFIISVSFHEAAHAFFAYRFGDDTAQKEGRLTLNPLAHLDILGTLMIIFVHFGWAKPVPVDARNMRHPDWQMPVVAAAGPLSNLFLAIVSIVSIYLVAHYPPAAPISLALGVAAYINVMLFVFNLLPIPPLDGAGMVQFFLPRRYKELFERYGTYGFVILIILVYLPVTRSLLGQAIETVMGWLFLAFQWVGP